MEPAPPAAFATPALDLWDSKRVAGFLGISIRTLARMRKAHQIPVIKIGRLNRYRQSDVERALARRTIQEVS
jgi:predicted DNA-binding transcriptional regulator AlpA